MFIYYKQFKKSMGIAVEDNRVSLNIIDLNIIDES